MFAPVETFRFRMFEKTALSVWTLVVVKLENIEFRVWTFAVIRLDDTKLA